MSPVDQSAVNAAAALYLLADLGLLTLHEPSAGEASAGAQRQVPEGPSLRDGPNGGQE